MSRTMGVVTRRKISVSVDQDRIAAAMELSGGPNASAVVDTALALLVDREQERRWLEAHPSSDLPGEVTPHLSDVPWGDQAPK